MGGCTKMPPMNSPAISPWKIFFLSHEELQRFLEHLDAEKLSLFYVTSPAQSGFTAG
jgi:hypothetical protein